MGTPHYYGNINEANPSGYYPLQAIGLEIVEPGFYATGLDIGGGVAFFRGTPEEFVTFAEELAEVVRDIRDHAAKPLTLTDFDYDEGDRAYVCPRCTSPYVFEAAGYDDLGRLVKDVQAHIDAEHVAPGL